MNDYAAIDAWIRAFASAPQAIATSAPDMAKVIMADIRRAVDAEHGPNGEPWPPSKDGDPVLQNAASKIQVTVAGKTIVLELGPPESFHHYGIGRPKRPILPSQGALSPSLVTALSEGQTEKLRNHFLRSA